jgi:hypothetical protein
LCYNRARAPLRPARTKPLRRTGPSRREATDPTYARFALLELGQGYRVLGFAPDGRTFWTARLAPSAAGGGHVFE